jgi:single-stranded-DNA-specific exonuclease
MDKDWVIATRNNKDIICDLLVKRCVKDHEAFLNPDFEKHRHSFALLPNINEAIDKVSEAIKNNWTIGLFGDYDADGIPGTALLYLGLKQIGVEAKIHIPRREFGYGLSKEGIDKFADLGVKLLITIDNGTSAIEEVDYAKSRNMNVIILDHHEPQEMLPDAIIVNPKLVSSIYPFPEICATAIVYKFLEALSTKQVPLSKRWLLWQLDLVALATVCDIVPLVDENRLLTFYGLKVLRKSRNIGLRALAKVSGVDLDIITSYEVGYMLGPRINASGRVSKNTEDVFHLLTTASEDLANKIAHDLNERNLLRQQELEKAVQQSDEQITAAGFSNNPIIIIKSKEWGIGIVGLIAARAMEKYCKPVICFCEEGELLKGSARSLPGYELPELLGQFSLLLEKWGGHNYAAGLTIKVDNYDQFCLQIILFAKQRAVSFKNYQLLLDSELQINEIEANLVDKLNKMQPYGHKNAKPLFYISDVTIERVQKMGGGKHLRGVVKQKGTAIPFVGFKLGNHPNMLSWRRLDIAASVRENEWMGKNEIQLDIKDVRECSEN